MNRAVPDNQGSMAAIIGLEDKIVQEICQEVNGICEIANYNSPGQIVISGEREAVEAACQLAEDKGARRTVGLKVSGPFHSSLMKRAAEDFANIIGEIEFKKPAFPVVSNVTADFVEEPEEIKGLLIKQISNSVRWVESIKLIQAQGVNTFIEAGPGKVLRGLLRRIDSSLTTYNIDDPETMQDFLNNYQL